MNAFDHDRDDPLDERLADLDEHYRDLARSDDGPTPLERMHNEFLRLLAEQQARCQPPPQRTGQ